MDDDLTAWAERVAPTLGPEHWPHMRAALAADPPASKHTQAQCRALLARVEAIADGLTYSQREVLRDGQWRTSCHGLEAKGLIKYQVPPVSITPLGHEVARVLRERGGGS